MDTVNERFTYLFSQVHITLSGFARRLGIPNHILSSWMRDYKLDPDSLMIVPEITPIPNEYFEKICEVTGVNYEWFAYGTGEMIDSASNNYALITKKPYPMKLSERFHIILEHMDINDARSSLASHLNVHYDLIADWESGKYKVPKKYLGRICEITGVNFEWFAYGTGEMINSASGKHVPSIAQSPKKIRENFLVILDHMSISQQELAKRLGVSRNLISNWKLGKGSVYHFSKICEVTGASYEWFVYGTGEIIDKSANNSLLTFPVSPEEVTKRFNAVLRSLKISQRELANHLSLSHTVIHNWKYGKTPIRRKHFKRICEVTGTNYYWLVYGVGEMINNPGFLIATRSPVEITQRFNTILCRLKISPREFARRLGISTAALYTWKNGESLIDKKYFCSICEITGVNYNWFVYGSGEMYSH